MDSNATAGLVGIFMGVLVAVLIFLVFRALVLWYWKVDKIVSLLESIDAKLGPKKTVKEPAGIQQASTEY